MDGGGGKEFADWELLQDSDENHPINSSHLSLLDVIEGDSEGIIRFDYFSLDSQLKYRNNTSLSEEGSVVSDNPSWIDPVVSESQYKRKNYSYSGEFFWSDSGSEKSIGFAENDKLQLGVDGIGEAGKIRVQEDDLSDLSSNNRLKIRGYDWKHEEQQVHFEEKDEISPCREDLGCDGSKQDIGLPENGQLLMGCKEIGDSSISGPRIGVPEMEAGLLKESNRVVEARNGWEALNEVHRGDIEEVDIEKKNEVAEEKGKEVKLGNVEDEVKSGLVWWKLPVELLKFCVFKISPVWSVSIAAAVVGFVILRRRLYKMRQKKMSLQMKVTMDDKVSICITFSSFDTHLQKVSQFMTCAAQLNEAFSVVKRVPIIRPSLPAPGLTPWPVISLR